MLNQNLRKLRLERNLSQEDVAKYLSISRQAYNFYETGKREPDNETLQRLADFFDVSLDFLFGRETKSHSEMDDSIGERLKTAREAKILTQDDVAEYLNVKRQTYSAYERNKSVPDALTLDKLAGLFDVSSDHLLGREIKTTTFGKREIELSEKDMREIKQKAEHIKSTLMGTVGLAFDGKIDDEDTLIKVIAALEEGLVLAKKEAKEKYTPKKYRK